MNTPNFTRIPCDKCDISADPPCTREGCSL